VTGSVVVTRGLTKRFGRVLAVDDVSIEVGAGDRYGFLGPNGSGKTTTVRMLLGLVFATSGTVELLGHPMPGPARRSLAEVGALVEGPAAYGHLSARTNLSLVDAAGPGGPRRTRRRRVDEALGQVGLDAVGRQPVKTFSLGMRARLGLAGALLRQPRLLVLDEPTNGLDPQGIHEVRELLLELNQQGTTLLVSSHLLSEVEAMCTRVGVLQAGRLVLQEDLDVLRAPTGRVLVQTPDPDLALSVLDGRVEGRDGDLLSVREDQPERLAGLLVQHGVRLTGLRAERRSLEQVVLELTGPGSDRVSREERR
jgi:ABC-type multidrug transport system ATPase subunit